MIMEIVCGHMYSITSVLYYRPGSVYGSLTCLKRLTGWGYEILIPEEKLLRQLG